MKRTVLILVLIAFVLSGCSDSQHAVVVGKNVVDYEVDIKLDGGEVKVIRLTGEQFYSGDFEVGAEWNVSCLAGVCSPIQKASE